MYALIDYFKEASIGQLFIGVILLAISIRIVWSILTD